MAAKKRSPILDTVSRKYTPGDIKRYMATYHEAVGVLEGQRSRDLVEKYSHRYIKGLLERTMEIPQELRPRRFSTSELFMAANMLRINTDKMQKTS